MSDEIIERIKKVESLVEQIKRLETQLSEAREVIKFYAEEDFMSDDTKEAKKYLEKYPLLS